MEEKSYQETLKLSHQEVLKFSNSLYYADEKTDVGHISQLALEAGDWTFTAVHVSC